MRLYSIIIFVFILMAFIPPGTAKGVTLDRTGNAPPVNCNPPDTKKHTFYTSKHGYEFHGFCISGLIPYTYRASGSWIYGGITSESIKYYDMAKNPVGSINATFYCQKDPWLYSDATCSMTNIAASPNSLLSLRWEGEDLLHAPKPLSFNVYSEFERAALKDEAKNAPYPPSPPPPPPPPPSKKKIEIAPGVIKIIKAKTPSIIKPAQGSAFCNSVPVEVQSIATPSNPIVKLEFSFERYKKTCGDVNNPACWIIKTIPGWQVINQPAVNSTIPRASFPQTGKWRMRVRAYPHLGEASDWTPWRQFRVKNDNLCL